MWCRACRSNDAAIRLLRLRAHFASWRRCIATTTLAASTNALIASIQSRRLPPFSHVAVADLTAAVDWAATAYTRDLHAHERTLRVTLPQVQWRDVVPPREVASDALSRAWGLVEHLLSVRNSPALRRGHDALQARVVQTIAEEAQSRTLLEAFTAIKQGNEWPSLTTAQQVGTLAVGSFAVVCVGIKHKAHGVEWSG